MRNTLILLTIILSACQDDGGQQYADVSAIANDFLTLGMVRNDTDGDTFRLMLCHKKPFYTEEHFAKTSDCLPALISKDGSEAIIPREHLNKRQYLKIVGTAKKVVVTSTIILSLLFFGKKIIKHSKRSMRKNKLAGLGFDDLSAFQRAKQASDLKLRNLQEQYDDLFERYKEAKKVYAELSEHGIEPRKRRYIPLFRTSEFKVIDDLDKQVKKALENLNETIEQDANVQKIYRYTQEVHQLNIDNTDDIASLRKYYQDNFADRPVNILTTNINGSLTYKKMRVGSARKLLNSTQEKIDAINRRIAEIDKKIAAAQAKGKQVTSLQKRKDKLLGTVETQAELKQVNEEAIAELQRTIDDISSTKGSVNSTNYEQELQALNTKVLKAQEELDTLTTNHLRDWSIAGGVGLFTTSIADFLVWGRDDRQLAYYWYYVFQKYGGLNGATEVAKVMPILKKVAKVFPDFELNPKIKEFLSKN